jgi:hypothetical protein
VILSTILSFEDAPVMRRAFWGLLTLLGLTAAAELNTIVIDSELNVKYDHSVNSSVEIIFLFSDAKQVN